VAGCIRVADNNGVVIADDVLDGVYGVGDVGVVYDARCVRGVVVGVGVDVVLITFRFTLRLVLLVGFS